MPTLLRSNHVSVPLFSAPEGSSVCCSLNDVQNELAVVVVVTPIEAMSLGQCFKLGDRRPFSAWRCSQSGTTEYTDGVRTQHCLEQFEYHLAVSSKMGRRLLFSHP